jgi:fatty acid-binding protein DegV
MSQVAIVTDSTASIPEDMSNIKPLIGMKDGVIVALFAELSPALAVHTGPGTAGLCYYPVDD